MNDGLLSLIRIDKAYIAGDYNWTEVLRLAKEQSVIGVALAGTQRLPSDKWPPKVILFKWFSLTESIKKRNIRVNNVLISLISELQNLGIHPIVIKGQIVAQEYEQPLLRQSGDIDVFFDKADWSKVEQWLRDENINYSRSAAEKHIEIDYHGVSIELHYHLNAFSSSRVMAYWNGCFEENALERSRFVEIDGKPVRTLGITDTLVHLIVHVHHHLLTEGVGLRQLMDIALFIHNHFNDLDLNQLHKHLKGICHEKAFNAYMALLNKYVGLPKEQIPFKLNLKDYVYADKIMEEVWTGGNFGYKNNLKGVKAGLLHSLNTARLVIGHSIRFYYLTPSEARAYWWHKIFWRMKRKAHKQ